MKKLIKQAFQQYVSGVADLNEKGEVKVKGPRGDNIFVTFFNNSLEYVVVAKYFQGGQKFWEAEYQNGKLHGKHSGWPLDGEKGYQNGKLVYEKRC